MILTKKNLTKITYNLVKNKFKAMSNNIVNFNNKKYKKYKKKQNTKKIDLQI